MSFPISINIPGGLYNPVTTPINNDPIIINATGNVNLLLRLTEQAQVTFGSSSATLSPGNNIVSSGTSGELQLVVSPWSACEVINLGYSAGDGGDINQSMVLHPIQPITSISGIPNAYNLRNLLLSETPITSLDCSGCSLLERIECYWCTSLATANLIGCSSLQRPCFEDGALLSLNLSYTNNLRDIRASFNNISDFVLPTNVSNIWHFCAMGNNFSNLNIDFSQYVNLSQLWVSSSHIQGPVIIRSGQIDSMWLENNNITSLDLDNQVLGSANGTITCQNNQITYVTVSGCTGITNLNLENNLLPQNIVDQVISQLVAVNTTNRVLNLGGTGNAAPSATGLTNVATLRSRGWTVTHN